MSMIALAVLVLVFAFPVMMYNSLIGRKNATENAFSSVDTLLKKRYDLIPNLVAAVKNYMQHEKGTLTEITEMRAKAISPDVSAEEKVALDSKITKALGGIMVSVENYPNLKADQTFLQLQRSLNEIEEQISAARRAYNATVNDFNNAVEMFPTSLIAGMMGLSCKSFFTIPQQERQNPDVDKLFKA